MVEGSVGGSFKRAEGLMLHFPLFSGSACAQEFATILVLGGFLGQGSYFVVHLPSFLENDVEGSPTL